MADSKGKDQFANYAIVSVTESAANTLTFKKLETGISLTEKVAWIVNRVEYIIGSMVAAQFDANQDKQLFGLSISNSFAIPALDEITIVDFNFIQRRDFGAAANVVWTEGPMVKDFSSLPGGGIIIPPSPLYLYTVGTSLVAASTVVARIHYTLRTLAIDEYWELVEARRVLSS
jgi:hypothetical protein